MTQNFTRKKAERTWSSWKDARRFCLHSL